MTEFLSEENIALHKEYVRQKRLKYSILETSLPGLKGVEVRDLFHIRLERRDREDALLLYPEIVLHDLYFASFCDEKYISSKTVLSVYGSEAAFLNMLYGLTQKSDHGFLIVGRGLRASVVTDYAEAFRRFEPQLAVDLCEHAYFLDYGFDRERYVISCLSHLNLKKLTT